ncbi:hypothetical protein Psi02_37350 [Planotetraspora silvatica]|uniref:Uncharacterized protein n=1 Tax=Planotetraspora silvatica TaxID=234614 RepID=A0A8J3UPX4_9ACTN|nr:hypothetical protein [Planotetraspora silvatica]GII47311.1 hypothetical protein Psi02_37350 [Planotetraspora silvatica]
MSRCTCHGGPPTEINGVPTITLRVVDGSKIYVATEGKPYILRIASPSPRIARCPGLIAGCDGLPGGLAFAVRRHP